MELKGHTRGAGDGGGGESVQYQFNVEEALFSVVKVWDVESCVNDAAGISAGKSMVSLSLSLSLSLHPFLPPSLSPFLSFSGSIIHTYPIISLFHHYRGIEWYWRPKYNI